MQVILTCSIEFCSMHIEDVYKSGVTRRVTQFVKYAARWSMVFFSYFLLVLLIY